jgi:glycosyltransferase involved in cell wall biosynthesis
MNYIKTAIDSVINQKTSFNCEIVIGEDCLIDGTKEIVLPIEFIPVI